MSLKKSKHDTFCDTPKGGVVRAYKDLDRHRGLVSCCTTKSRIHGMEEVVGSIPTRSTI